MKKIAVIGCGVRSAAYLLQFKDIIGKEIELVALADPDTSSISEYTQSFETGKDFKTYTNGPDLIKELGDSLDGVIIGSPNAKHVESASPAMGKKLAILLEKPVATTVEDCRIIWKDYLDSGKPDITIGFVLRYTNFYRKVKEIIDSKAIGQILSIEATEMLNTSITSFFTRSWRRFEKNAGPFIVEKCSHDMDILNMLAGVPAKKVSSFAARTRFVANPEAAMHCSDCKLNKDCRYSSEVIETYSLKSTLGREDIRTASSANDLCVFNSEKDVPDHQVINIEYENGILAAFSAGFDQPVGERTIRINGTDGRLVGNLYEDYIEVLYHKKDDKGENIKETFTIKHDDSGHSGGDSVLAGFFKSIMNGEPTKPLAGLKEGIDACLVGFAAEKSRHENIIVNMKDLYKNVYGDIGHIDLKGIGYNDK